MALTDEDLDRIGDKMTIAVMRGMEEHRSKDHTPVEKRIAQLQRHQWYERGAFAALALWMGWKHS